MQTFQGHFPNLPLPVVEALMDLFRQVLLHVESNSKVERMASLPCKHLMRTVVTRRSLWTSVRSTRLRSSLQILRSCTAHRSMPAAQLGGRWGSLQMGGPPELMCSLCTHRADPEAHAHAAELHARVSAKQAEAAHLQLELSRVRSLLVQVSNQQSGRLAPSSLLCYLAVEPTFLKLWLGLSTE